MEHLVSFMLRPLCSREESALGTPWIVGWVGPRAGLDVSEKRISRPLPGFEPRFLWIRARSAVTVPTELSRLRLEGELHFVNWRRTVKVAIFVPARVAASTTKSGGFWLQTSFLWVFSWGSLTFWVWCLFVNITASIDAFEWRYFEL